MNAGRIFAATLVLVLGASWAWAGDTAPVTPAAPTGNVAAICVYAPYCYKTAPCVTCPPTGTHYACYDAKPMPCVTCPPCGNYYAPYCGKPSPVCYPPPRVKGSPCPPCRYPCD